MVMYVATGQVSGAYRDLLLDSNIAAHEVLRVIGHRQLDVAVRRSGGRVLRDSELLPLF